MSSRFPDTAEPELSWAGAGSCDLSRQESQTVSRRSANCQTRICSADFWKPGSSQGPWRRSARQRAETLWGKLFPAFAWYQQTSAFLCQSSKSRIGWLCLADSAHRRSGGQRTQLHLGWTRFWRQLGFAERIIHAFVASCSCIGFIFFSPNFVFLFCILRRGGSSKVRPSGEGAYLDLGKPSLAYCPGRLTESQPHPDCAVKPSANLV